MTRFTKYTLTVAVLILAAAATTGAVTYSYYWRGRIAFGGEWLIPAVVLGVWEVGREVKRTWRFMVNGNRSDNTKNR